MEGTGLSKLLDGVLIDSISDFEAFNELKRDVDHQLIQAAPEQRAYLVDYIQEGIEMQIIDSEDGQTYQKYLKALDKNPSARVPELRNLDDRLGMKGEMKHPSALKAAELFHTLNKLHLKRQANLFSSMTKLVSHRWDWHLSDLRIKHDLEIKRLQCSRLVSQLRRAMAVNLDNTVANWRINSQPPVLAALSPPAPEPPRQRETIKPRDHFYEEYFEEDVEESEYMRKRLMHKRSLKDYEKRDRQYKYVIKLIGLCSVRFEQLAYWRWRLVYEKEKLRRDKLKEAFGLAELIAKTHTKKAYFDSWIENMKELPVKETRFSAVYTLMQRMSRTTRSSMINWKVNASTSSFKDEINRIRSKSLGILKKVPRRTQKDAVDSLAGSKKEYIRALRVFMKSFQSTTQSAFSKWQRKTVPTKTVTKITEVEADPKITHDYRPNLLSCYLERVPRSNLRFALSRFFKESGVKTTLALHRLTEYSTRKPRSAMTSWKSHMLAVQERKLLDSSRSFRLSNLLKKLIHTNLQKSYDRVVGDGSLLHGAFRRLNKQAETLQKSAVSTWKSYVSESKSQDRVRGKVLAGLLNRVPHRRLKDAVDRKFATQAKLKESFIKMDNVAKRVPVQTMNSWYRNSSRKSAAADTQARTLQSLLRKLPNSSTRDALDRILSDGNKIKGVFRRLSIYAEKRPKALLEKWRQSCNDQSLLEKVRGMQGKETKIFKALFDLSLITKQNSKTAFDKWGRYVKSVAKKDLLDNARSYKLKNHLDRVTRPTLAKSLDTIVGGGKKWLGTLYRLDAFATRKPLEVFKVWNDYINESKQHEISDKIRSERLRNHLNNIPRRSLKTAYNRVVGDGKDFKRSITIIDKFAKKIPQQTINQWQRNSVTEATQEADKARRFVEKLSRLPKPTLRAAADRLYGKGKRVKGALRRLEKLVESKPEIYLQKWRDFNSHAKLIEYFNKNRGQENKLYIAMSNFVKEAQRKPKIFFDKWRKGVQYQKELQWFIQNRKLSLQNLLEKIVKPNLRKSLDTILGGGNRLTGVFYRLDSLTTRKLGHALKKWNDFLSEGDIDNISKEIRSERLRNCLNRLPRKTLRNAFSRVTDNDKKLERTITSLEKVVKKVPLQAVNIWFRMATLKAHEEQEKAQNFVNKLSSVPLRTLRNANDHILGNGDRCKGALRRLLTMSEKKPIKYFFKWISACREARVVDYLEKNRGKENKVTLALAKFVRDASATPRSALSLWNKNVFALRAKNLQTSNKSDKLNFLMSKIARPTLRNSFNRTVGEGSLFLGALRNLNFKLKQKPIEAIAHWRKGTAVSKGNDLSDNLNGVKLLKTMQRIPIRSLRTAFDRTATEPKQLKSTLLNIEKIARRRPVQAVNRFNSNVIEKSLENETLGQRLAAILERVPRKLYKDVAQNFLDEGDNVKRSLRTLEISVTQRKRQALEKLADNAALKRDKEWDDELKNKGQKVAVSLSNLINAMRKKSRNAVNVWNSKAREKGMMRVRLPEIKMAIW
mmetsp:Transcript_34163/g.59690  ORF Transcript_34163/g.59690 Transcript_34163/m.59690 type:complete len:1503 (+) Transcript_34163:18-4526(+)